MAHLGRFLLFQPFLYPYFRITLDKWLGPHTSLCVVLVPGKPQALTYVCLSSTTSYVMLISGRILWKGLNFLPCLPIKESQIEFIPSVYMSF